MEDLYERDGKLYRETFGIPTQKQLKQDGLPAIFPKIIDRYTDNTTSHSRLLSERREQRSVRMNMDAFYCYRYRTM